MTEEKLPPAPKAMIVSTGTEITQGLYADTNAMNLSRFLMSKGFLVTGHFAVPDEAERIRSAVRATFGQCDLVLMTGGIGPTEDDLNRETLAELWGCDLVRNEEAEEMIRTRFATRRRPMPETNLKQALIPEGAIPLLNHWGTAAGFVLPRDDSRPAVAALPGPPHEWSSMLEAYFDSGIAPLFPGLPAIRVHTLHLAMIPESQVNQHLRPLFGPHPARQLTLLASRGHIRVRLIATGPDEERCRSELEQFLAEAKALLPADWIFWEGPDQIDLGEPVVKLFQQQGKKIALAESCTGGGVARMLTDVPGCSDVLLEGWVTYSNRSKEERLGVSAMTIAEKGAVSEECAREMAAGAQSRSGADVALAITGIAGPGGGSPEKPVGTVWFALHDSEGRSLAHLRRIGGDRETVRRRSEIEALDLLRRWILGLKLET